MTEIQKEEILNQIRKQHKIALDYDDPIFALVTANEIILNHYINKLDQKHIQQKVDIETITEQYLTKAKELAEKQILHATQKAHEQIIQTTQKLRAEQRTDQPTHATNYSPALLFLCTVAGAIGGYTLAFLLL